MKTTKHAIAILFGSTLLAFSLAHAAPITVPADNEAGLKQQAEHPGEHKTRMEVRNEGAQWRATHTGPGTNCPGGQVYCSDNHTGKMLKGESSSSRSNRSYSSDIYMGP